VRWELTQWIAVGCSRSSASYKLSSCHDGVTDEVVVVVVAVVAVQCNLFLPTKHAAAGFAKDDWQLTGIFQL
jgi:hypothetical protein